MILILLDKELITTLDTETNNCQDKSIPFHARSETIPEYENLCGVCDNCQLMQIIADDVYSWCEID